MEEKSHGNRCRSQHGAGNEGTAGRHHGQRAGRTCPGIREGVHDRKGKRQPETPWKVADRECQGPPEGREERARGPHGSRVSPVKPDPGSGPRRGPARRKGSGEHERLRQ